MKICWIGVDLFDTGGISTYSRYVVRALNELDKKEYTLSSIINLSFHKYRINFDLKTYSRIITFDYRTLKNRLIALFKSIQKIYKSELVILNHSSLFIFAIVAKILRKKIIVFGYNIDILFLKGIRKKVIFNFADQIIVDCTYTKKTLREKFNIESKLLFDPIEKFVSKKKKKVFSEYTNEKRMKLVTVAVLRMSQNKGHRQVFKAIKELRDLHIKYLIVGDGPDYNNLRAIVDKYKINDSVEFKGYVTEKEKYEIMEESDISILISKRCRNGEGLPLGLIEPGPYGNAMIGGNEDGSTDAIDKDKPNGFLINPQSIKDLKRIIRKYYFDNELLEEHKQNSIDYCNKNFIYEVFKDKFKKYIDDLIKK